jgi:hypothetical protein
MLIAGRTTKSAKSIPVVVTNLTSIAIIARRLGMLWKTFDIHRSIFHAEGNGMVMTTAVARSSVTVIQFDSGGRKMSASFPLDQIYIPSEDADRLGFGIITTWYKDPRTNEPDRFVMYFEDVTPDLKLPTAGVFPDMVPFASRMLHEKGSLVTRIPKPHDFGPGLTSNELYLQCYFAKIQDLRNTHPEWSQLQWLCETNEHLTISHGDWTKGKSGEGFLDDIHDQYDKTTSYFDSLEDRQNLRYRDLMQCHHRFASELNIESGYGDDARMESYFDVYLPDLYRAMAEKGYSGTEGQVTEAWATMIFRGICWNCCHSMVEGERVPSRIWGSRLPVYIG